MTHFNLPHTIKSIAIIDDDFLEADVTSITVQDAGFEPLIVRERFESEIALAAAIRERAQAAICDHRLSPRGYAQYYGASVVAELFRQGVPALLVTQFLNQDNAVSIRQHRRYIPVLLRRSEINDEQIKAGLVDCAKEIRGEFLPGRKPWRSLIRVESTGNEDNQSVVDVIIPSWNPKESLRFPASLVPEELRESLRPGLRLLAMVNIGAEKAEDLFFYDFELAPEPVPESELD